MKGTRSIIRFGNVFQIQPADFCKIFVNLALAKYLSRVETDFARPRSQLIAAVIALVPAVLSILQNETGLALVYFSFFLVMFREGLPSAVLIIGFSFAVLVVATLLLEPNTLALILTRHRRPSDVHPAQADQASAQFCCLSLPGSGLSVSASSASSFPLPSTMSSSPTRSSAFTI